MKNEWNNKHNIQGGAYQFGEDSIIETPTQINVT